MPYNGYYSNRPQKPEKWSPEDDTKGQTETFVTRNVKLITFLVCLAVFLIFFGPWSVMRIMEWVEMQEAQEEFEATALTYSELSEIVEKGTRANWSDFQGHHYETIWETGMVMRQYKLKEGDFTVTVTSVSETFPPDSILIVRESDGARLDLMACEIEEARAFIQK